MKVKTTNRFEKDLKKVAKQDKQMIELYQQVVDQFERGAEIDRKYNLHKLDGCFSGYHGLHIKPNLVMVLLIDRKRDCVEFYRIGSHGDIIENRKWSPKFW